MHRARSRAINLAALTVGHGSSYDVRANWKLVFQNYSECLHCPMIHPSCRGAAVPERRERPDRGPVPRRLHGDHAAERERDDERARVRAAGEPGDAGRGSAPRVLLLADAEHAAEHPSGLRELLHRDAGRGGSDAAWSRSGCSIPDSATDPTFNPEDAIEFWDVTNRQDWDIVERSQLGIASRRYAPGPYSPRESMPAAWDREYLRHMGRHLMKQSSESGAANRRRTS